MKRTDKTNELEHERMPYAHIDSNLCAVMRCPQGPPRRDDPRRRES